MMLAVVHNISSSCEPFHCCVAHAMILVSIIDDCFSAFMSSFENLTRSAQTTEAASPVPAPNSPIAECLLFLSADPKAERPQPTPLRL